VSHDRFARALQRYRRMRKLTQEELAAQSHYSYSLICKLESGERSPSRAAVERLATALQLSPNDRRIFIALSHGEDAAPPSRSSPPLYPARLPTPLTPLLGRERDLSVLERQLVGSSVRLITLYGPPGVGKTRLALQVAAALANTFADGVWFVALATLNDATQVLEALARSLGLNPHSDQLLVEQVTAALAEQQILLLLDNFEQVIEASGTVADLLEYCSRLKILVTSRERLRVYGEYAYLVPTLELPPLPQLNKPYPWATLLEYPAVELFVQRAQAVEATFELTANNAPAVAEICVRLDGLPLALELAAARVNLFAPAALLRRLMTSSSDTPLDLLNHGPRNRLPRQQTLLNAIAWSYDLLEPTEQQAFRALAVFVGGWTIAAAAAVLELEERTMLERLASLMDKSLLVRNEGEKGEPRFTMLELIRTFALEQLALELQAALFRQRHGMFFWQLAEKYAPLLTSEQQTEALNQFVREQDNIRAALRWATQHHETDLAVGLSGVLWRFWWMRSQFSEGLIWIEDSLALPLSSQQSENSLRLRARAYQGGGVLAAEQGDYARSQPHFEQALALGRQLNDERLIAGGITSLGIMLMFAQSYEQAAMLLTEGLALAKTEGNPWSIANCQINLGILEIVQGQPAAALPLLHEAHASFVVLGDTVSVANVLGNLGLAYLLLGNLGDAARCYRETIAAYQPLGDADAMADSIDGYARLAALNGYHQRAALLYGAAAAMRERLNHRLFPGFQALLNTFIAETKAALEPSLYEQSWLAGYEIEPQQAVALALQ
jgi:predicted ATPase/DNA-binding XRE family transcriptional regulator